MTLPLTPREHQVLRMFTLTDKEICARLSVSPGRVGSRVDSVLHKLGAQSKAQALVIALRQGLVELGEIVDGAAPLAMEEYAPAARRQWPPKAEPAPQRMRYRLGSGAVTVSLAMSPVVHERLCQFADAECAGNVSEMVRRLIGERAAAQLDRRGDDHGNS
jgi:DNA-binding CsgD family transcriptional regulator